MQSTNRVCQSFWKEKFQYFSESYGGFRRKYWNDIERVFDFNPYSSQEDGFVRLNKLFPW